MNWWAKEPALIIGLVQAVIMLAVSFGLNISDSQIAAITGMLAAVLAVIGAVVTRSQVSPAKTPSP